MDFLGSFSVRLPVISSGLLVDGAAELPFESGDWNGIVIGIDGD